MVEVNEVLYPDQFDTPLNFPSVTEVTEATGEDINRNRDAIFTLERVLGLDPHIGLFTENPDTATVDERIGIIENGIAEGRFAFRDLNVNNAFIVDTDITGNATVDIGGDVAGTTIAPVFIRGPLRILDSGLANNQAISDVPFVINARANVVEGDSFPGVAVMRITDTNPDPNQSEKQALVVDGNVLIRNGRLTAEFAISHTELLDIDTTPRAGQQAFHVTRGDFHSHRRKRDPATGALLNEVDPNPPTPSDGLIDHTDLLSIFTKSGQSDFVPVEGVAYHVTGGDDHDHKDDRGAQIDHLSLKNIDPKTSNHITGGDSHAHGPRGDGAPVDHFDLLNSGFLTHAEIDQQLNVVLPEHIATIDPLNASEVDPAQAGSAAHVPLGHVSDPSAHHPRYTNEEALDSEALVSGITQNYTEGQNTTLRGHIQAVGNGTVSNRNPHGLAAADVGALEGFDAQGNLPDFTKQFLESVIEDILQDPAFGVVRASEDETITGLWTFNNINGIIIQDGPGGTTSQLLQGTVARFPDMIDHIDNTGTPPFHAAVDLSFDPAGSTTPLVSTDIDAALKELDSLLAAKEDTLSPSNQVATAQIEDLAVTNAKIANATIENAKKAEPFALVPLTFTTNVPVTATANRYGVKLPAAPDAVGEIYDISVMWHDLGAGGATGITVDVLLGPGGGPAVTIIGGPVNINAPSGGLFPADTPGRLTPGAPVPVTGTTSGDDIIVAIGHTGAGDYDVTVTVWCKIFHLA